MLETQLNLCDEIIKNMRKIGFSEKAIDAIQSNPKFINVQQESDSVQRTVLTMIFYDILMYQPKTVPTHIRVSLNISNNSLGWLEDVTSTILPFIKANEEDFFS